MSISELSKKKPWINWLLFFATIIIVFVLGVFAASILERRTEAQLYFQMVRPIEEWEPNNAVWGENFPRQYQTYMQTADTSFRSKWFGSAWVDYLADYPELVIIWAGMPFSRDYNQARGHYYSIKDVHNTLRTGVTQPATCWACKTSDFPRLIAEMGVAEFYSKTLAETGHLVHNHIGCVDCHNPRNMALRITRPALVEAFARQGIDITKATRQEMRSLVCAQCHVEYYFRQPGNYLVFPWDKGLTAEAMEAYYDSIGHRDWVHALSRAPMLKTQHPDYELFMTGIHAQRGVSCADCHMPYKREGGIKFTDHHIRSPLANIASSCQTCHRQSEEVLRQNVFDNQARIVELRRICEINLARVHIEAKFAWEAGATEEEMAPVLQKIRHAQWRWDWVAAAKGLGVHSPSEALRVLGTAIQRVNEARLLLSQIYARHDKPFPPALPDVSTKEKAQAFIGLNMEQLRREKDEWRQTVLPTWLSNY